MFEPGLETVLETDASDFVTAAVLSQRGRDGILRPVAFLSKKMTPAECNYDIYDKELMAIVKAFEEWRPELSAAEHVEEFENLPGDQDKPILVLSDHKNLEYFMSTKQLNRRQARWAEFLSGFNFKITYRPGAQGTKPDSLTRRTQDLPAGSDDERVKHQERILLSPDRFLYTAANTVQELATEEPLATDPTADAAGAPQEEEEIPLNLAIQQLYASDEEVQTAVRQLEAGEPCPMLRRHKIRDATTAEGLIYVKNRYGKLCLYLPPSDDPTNKVRTRVIRLVTTCLRLVILVGPRLSIFSLDHTTGLESLSLCGNTSITAGHVDEQNHHRISILDSCDRCQYRSTCGMTLRWTLWLIYPLAAAASIITSIATSSR